VVGLLITRYATHRLRARWRTDEVVGGRVIVDEAWPEGMTYCEPVNSHEMIADPAWSIDYVWTHRAHRRRGTARLLVDEAIQTHEINVAEGLTWKHPFLTSAGASLAYRYNADEFWLA